MWSYPIGSSGKEIPFYKYAAFPDSRLRHTEMTVMKPTHKCCSRISLQVLVFFSYLIEIMRIYHKYLV